MDQSEHSVACFESSSQHERDLASPTEVLTVTTIYRDHVDFLNGVLRGHRVPDSDREDVLQKVFDGVAKGLPTFDRSRPLRSWLYGIARLCALSWRRSYARRRENLGGIEQISDTTPNPEEMLIALTESARRRLLVAEVIDTLHPDRRRVLVAVALCDMSIAETADALGICCNTTKTRLRLARRDFEHAWNRCQLAHARRRTGVVTLPAASVLLAYRRELPPVSEAMRARLGARLPVETLPPCGPQVPPAPRPNASALRPTLVTRGLSQLVSASLSLLAVAFLPEPHVHGLHEAHAETTASTSDLPTNSPEIATSWTAGPATSTTPSALIPASTGPLHVPPSARPHLAAASASSTLTREDRVLARARLALDRGDLIGARANLEAHARDFPKGKLARSRDLLWVRLLEAEGRAGGHSPR